MSVERFLSDEKVREELKKWAKWLAGNSFEGGIKKFIPLFTVCIERTGDCVEKLFKLCTNIV